MAGTTSSRINLTLEDTQRLARLVTEWGSVDDLAAALASRRRPGPPPMTAREILDAYNLKVITRAETRRMLGIRATATRRRPPAGGAT